MDVSRKHLDKDDNVRELILAMTVQAHMEIFVKHTMDILVLVQPSVVERIEIVHKDDVVEIVSFEM